MLILRKIILSLFTTVLSFTFCYSQDAITKKSGEDIQAKILEVGQTEIKYKKFDNLEGPTFTMPKSDILLVRYENGTKDIFNEENKPAAAVSSSGDFYIDGKNDASKYYKSYKAAGTGTLITGLLSPLVGLIPAVACS